MASRRTPKGYCCPLDHAYNWRHGLLTASGISCHASGGIFHVVAKCRPDRQRDERRAGLPAAARFCRQGPHRLHGAVRKPLPRGGRRPGGLLGPHGRRTALVRAVPEGAPVGRAVGQVVRRREDERLLQLPRYSSANPAAEQGGPDLGGRAGRYPRADLPDAARRGLPLCQRAEEAGRRPGRRGFDLYAAGAGTGDCHAGLRRDRRDPLRDFRRLLRRGHRRAEQQRLGQGGPHRRRRLAPRQAIAA